MIPKIDIILIKQLLHITIGPSLHKRTRMEYLGAISRALSQNALPFDRNRVSQEYIILLYDLLCLFIPVVGVSEAALVHLTLRVLGHVDYSLIGC